MLKGGTAEPVSPDEAAPTPPAATAAAVKPPPAWVAAAKAEKGERAAPNALKLPAVAPVAKPAPRADENASRSTRSNTEPSQRADARAEKPKKRGYERKARTGREPGYATLSFNVGAQHEITPADLVGKIAGVTRLPAAVVGAIDIHEGHSHVDVAAEVADTVLKKLEGVRLKDVALHLAAVPPQG